MIEDVVYLVKVVKSTLYTIVIFVIYSAKMLHSLFLERVIVCLQKHFTVQLQIVVTVGKKMGSGTLISHEQLVFFFVIHDKRTKYEIRICSEDIFRSKIFHILKFNVVFVSSNINSIRLFK
jgi:hypothetical protein